MSSPVAAQIRRTMTSPFGNLPAWSSVATGYGPCRSCLETFRESEEERVYVTYDPFDGISDLPLPGPVFIHTKPCQEYSAAEFPHQLFSIPILFEGYGDHSRLMLTEPMEEKRLGEQIESILAAPGVNFIHLRNAKAGCFIARIVRA